MDKLTPQEIIRQYTVTGVPRSMIPMMCKELNINEDKLTEWLNGQTCGLVGGEAMIYPWDIERFIRNLPVID
jgi:hypothetical protein